jgi:hypothetical protein
MDQEAFEACGYPWPGNHPATRAPFVKANVTRAAQTHTMYLNPPAPPSREMVTEWDDDGPVVWKTLTDEELTAAQSEYEKALAEYRRTNGIVRVKAGPDLITGRFVCADGAWAEGELGPDGWRWTAWELD